MLLPANVFPPMQVITAWSAVAFELKITNAPVVTVKTALPAVVLSLKLASAESLTMIAASAAVELSKKNKWPGKLPMLLAAKLALPAEADPLKEIRPPLALKDVRLPALP